ncbi:MAG: translation initiation factor IF-2 [Oscillospiraceae bacterium]|nr:translation initiation factor IF-2 [Oscillospiraceae bacterium]
MLIKYRLGELAKDFGLQNKEIVAILNEKFPGDKKYATVLTEPELNYVFNAVTKKYASENFNEYIKIPEPQAAPAAAAQTPKAPAGEAVQQPKPKKQPQEPKRDRITKVVDTGAAAVDLDRYNEKYDNLADTQVRTGGQMSSRKTQSQGNKQKLSQKSKQGKYRQIRQQKKETEAEKLQRIQLEKARKAQLKISIPDEITVGELATRLKATSATVVKKLMSLGIMASVSDVIDFDTAYLVAEEMNAKVEREVHVTIEERLIDDTADEEKDLMPRAPVVVVMGHVDHGKTSLLDYIRKTKVTASEAGGITQHIGAYRVDVNGKQVTFLDTPGHEAFTAMRARGAMMTDIAILVVAADDGIMPQTIEAINHAKAAGVSIIVAINKIDRPTANPDRVKTQLTEHGLIPEEWGGDVICCPVSAVTGEGVDNLLEMLVLVSDMKELKANPNRFARGTVIEAKLDKGRGPVASVLIQNGTLHAGDIIIAGTAVGRVRTMINDRGERVKSAGPSDPVEIAGLIEVPNAGDVFNAVEDERLARELAEQRKAEIQKEQWGNYTKVTLENLFSQIEEGERKELPIVVKADVQGTAEALKQSLEKLSTPEVRVSVIHTAVGGITANDVMLAKASGAIIIGFNVRPDSNATDQAKQDNVEMRMYRVIYDAMNDVESAMKGMLAPKTREVEQGRVEVREVYKISSVGTVAGCYVTNGTITRGSLVRVVRDGIIIYDDKVGSLRRFKDDVREVAQGYECGVTLDKFTDIKEGDVFETYTIEEYRE